MKLLQLALKPFTVVRTVLRQRQQAGEPHQAQSVAGAKSEFVGAEPNPLLALHGLTRHHALTPPTGGLGFEVVDTSDARATPMAGTVLTYDYEWKGRRVPVAVSFDEASAAFLASQGYQVDMKTATLVREGESVALGQVPGWEQLLGGAKDVHRTNVLASEAVLVTEFRVSAQKFSDGSWALEREVVQLETDLNVFQMHAQAPVQRSSVAERFAPVTLTEGEFARTELAPGVSISGVSVDSVSKALPVVHRVLGLLFNGRAAQLTASQSERKLLARLSKRVDEAPERGPAQTALINEVQSVLAPGDERRWSIEDATNALRSRLFTLDMAMSDLEIVVVPPGKHWSSMPQWASERSASDDLSSQGHVRVVVRETPEGPRLKRLAFIPKDSALVQHHELVHVLEETLSPADRALVAQSFEAARLNKGPFARLYGGEKGEYLTTMAELFFGCHGDAGVEWLKEKVPVIYGVLSRATGYFP